MQVFFRGNKIIEVSTLRSSSEFDLEGQDLVLAANNTFGTLEEDAFRRDLTINALFYEIENRTIIDYTGGVRTWRRASSAWSATRTAASPATRYACCG